MTSAQILSATLKVLKFCLPFFFRKKKLSKVNILFIDDEHAEFAIVRTLSASKRYGSVESVGDLDDLDSTALKHADIIFLDVQGV